VWVSDITYFKINGYGLYLCVILDLFSRRIIAYNISRKASTQLVTSSFKEAFSFRGMPAGLTFHSDRGTQYTSVALTQLLARNDVRQSFSASGRPLDNAVSETFFATFKKEEAYRRDYVSERNAVWILDKNVRKSRLLHLPRAINKLSASSLAPKNQITTQRSGCNLERETQQNERAVT